MSAHDSDLVIKDPVHGYIRVLPHERFVVDHAVTQRLRNIVQTGLAQYVYPEARTSRFSHSLGAMHLASRFFRTAYSRATPREQDLFCKQVRTVAGLKSGDDIGRTCEEGLRLAALFHDLGHLPFSHDFEFALKVHLRSTETAKEEVENRVLNDRLGKAPHETIGHALAPMVFSALSKSKKQPRRVHLAFDLAALILEAQSDYTSHLGDEVNALGWLHSLVDGEVDVDRCDYLLRDARQLGLEEMSFDLARLADNLVLAHVKNVGFITVIDERGLIALESFLIARSRNSQVMIRHHKNAQCGAAFRHATAAALQAGFAGEFLDVIKQVLSGDKKNAEVTLRQFAALDDAWWLGQLRRFEKECRSNLTQACLGLVLRREANFVSLWKRAGALEPHLLREMNYVLDESLGVEGALEKDFGKNGFLYLHHHFKPFKDGPKLAPWLASGRQESLVLVKRASGQLQPASVLSTGFSSLRDWYSSDMHFHLSAIRRSQGEELADVQEAALVLFKKYR